MSKYISEIKRSYQPGKWQYGNIKSIYNQTNGKRSKDHSRNLSDVLMKIHEDYGSLMKKINLQVIKCRHKAKSLGKERGQPQRKLVNQSSKRSDSLLKPRPRPLLKKIQETPAKKQLKHTKRKKERTQPIKFPDESDDSLTSSESF